LDRSDRLPSSHRFLSAGMPVFPKVSRLRK
jgi:hypothetical protein